MRGFLMYSAVALASGYLQAADAVGKVKPAPVVEAMVVAASQPLATGLQALGTVKPNETVMVRPEIAGRVIEIGFLEGRQVRKGQLLVRLDDSVLSAELAADEASVALAEAEYKRYSALLRDHQVSQTDFDKKSAELDQARASLHVLKAKLAQYRITAPFAGDIGLRQFAPGDVVQPGQALVALYSMSPLKMDIRLPETQAQSVHLQQHYAAVFDAFPGLNLTGSITAMEAALDGGTRSILLRGVMRNTDVRLKAGMTARVTFKTIQSVTGVVVPEQAVVAQGGKFVVYKLLGKTAVATPVETGARLPGKVTILKGIQAGDHIVVSGQNKLSKPEMPVTAVPYAGAL